MALYTAAVAVATRRCSIIHPLPAAVAGHGKQQRTLKAVTHITIKGECTHKCEILCEFFGKFYI